MERILKCFHKKNNGKYQYLGIVWNLFREDRNPTCYRNMQDFFEFIDQKVRPKWCPYWFLNLLHLWGNDNSICRLRSARISRLRDRIIGGVMITDIKEKWGTLRIYGRFTPEIEEELKRLEDKINPFLEAY